MEEKCKRILITGGHATPAFAVVDELLKDKSIEIIWLGEKYNQRGTKNPSAEYVTVTNKYKLEFVDLKAGKLIRKWTPETFWIGILELINLVFGFIQSLYIIVKYKPSILLSFGGFLAAPVAFWASIYSKLPFTKKIHIITHEQTIVAGLANKFIAKFADKVLVSFEESIKYYPKHKTIFTGNPIRKGIFQVKSNSLSKDFDPSLSTIYITPGNQGSHIINKLIFEILPEILQKANIIHQTGNSTITGDFEKALEIKNNLPVDISHRYTVRDLVLDNEIGEAFGVADLIIARGGANTTLEILALGKLAIMIPIPWTSHDEQTKNAKLVESIGLAKVLKQDKSLTSSLLKETIEFALDNFRNKACFNGHRLESCKEVASKRVILDAAKQVSEILFTLIK